MPTVAKSAPALGFMPGLARAIFPPHAFPPAPCHVLPVSQNSGTLAPTFNPCVGGACKAAGHSVPGMKAPHPQLPEDWIADGDYLDARRSIGNLSCPRFVVSSTFAREQGLAGVPVAHLHPSHFLYQGWNSYWLRWIAHGKEAYFVVNKSKAELVFCTELLAQIRSQNLDLEAAAQNLAIHEKASQAKNIAMKSFAQHIVKEIAKLVPVATDVESHEQIRELQQQVADLTQQLQSRADKSDTSTLLNTPKAATCSQPSNLAGTPTSVPSSSPVPAASPPAATPGMPHKQLPLSFAPANTLQGIASHDPASVMDPPADGSSWLMQHCPGKFNDKEIRQWISSLALNDRNKKDLDAWLKQVEEWVSQQEDADFLDKLKRRAVTWGIPPASAAKLQKSPLARLIAVASYMER